MTHSTGGGGGSEPRPSLVALDSDVSTNIIATTSSRANETLGTLSDSYHVGLHGALWDIIQDTKRVRGILEETVHD